MEAAAVDLGRVSETTLGYGVRAPDDRDGKRKTARASHAIGKNGTLALS
jgi:hypothetical protein